MSLYVVDASAAIKWILPEPAWDDALRIAPRFTDPAGFPLLDASLVTRESFAKGAQPRQSSAGCPLVPPVPWFPVADAIGMSTRICGNRDGLSCAFGSIRYDQIRIS